jgi:DNA anti-recombination protein RmuC
MALKKNLLFKMDSRIEKIEETQQEILLELRKLAAEIQTLQVICGRMDGHISFVESTYDKFRYPLDVVKSKVESLFGRAITNTTDLKAEDKN